MKNYLYFIICITFLFSSCTNIFNSDKNIAKKLDILNAKFFVLKHDQTNNQVLYKIVEKDGKFIEEKSCILNEDGDEIDSEFSQFSVNSVYKFNDEYVCMYGKFKLQISKDQESAKDYTCILIRVSDGAIFDFEGYFPWTFDYFGFNSLPQFDNTGNIYFSTNGSLNKLTSNSSGIKVETYLPNCGTGFHIAGNGDCYYSTGTDLRVKKSEGGIVINNTIRLPHYQWHEFSPSVYLQDNQNNVWCTSYTTIAKIKKTEDDNILISDTIYSDINIGEPGSQFDLGYSNVQSNYGIAFTNYNVKALGLFIDFNEKKSYYLQMPDLLNLAPYKLINNTLFVHNPYKITLLYAIDLTKYEKASESTYNLTSYKQINFPENLENITYSISNDNEILFQGFRPSDEMNISGIISSENKTTILTTSKSSNYTNLIRLN